MLPRPHPTTWLVVASLASGCLPAGPTPPPAAAPVLELSVDEAFYGVGGVTPGEVNLDLARKGPIHQGAHRQGLTDFRLAYSYVAEREDRGCRAARPRVRVDVRMTLPRWRDRDGAPAWLRSDWDLFLGRLRAHERGHQRIALDTGRRLLDGMAALRAADCETLRASAVALVESYRSRVAEAQRGWDEDLLDGGD